MSTMDAVLIGALGMAAMILVVVCAVVAVWKVWPMLAELTKGFTELVKAVRGVPETLSHIKEELAFMRGMAQQQQVPAGSGGEEGYIPAAGAAPANPSDPIRFPSPAWDRFTEARPVPDLPDDELEEGQIELLNQTDDDMVAMENLEKVRQRSGVVEDSDAVHEAVIVESE